MIKCNGDEDKIEYIQDKTEAPSNHATEMANTKFFPPCKAANREASRGLMKISANCLSVLMYFITISPFSTWSLKKWCLTFMYFALPWKTKFWARHMTLELSHMRATLL
jgi:hypothetical protein